MIVGTAGHIDHGKSALVRALTGQEMDRLAEERKRGITIELNFAALPLEGASPIGMVDVPGHEDFIRTMVAGATGIDLVLLVVDAQEGIMPQTLEHLAIAEQLGVPSGIPVLTKVDLVEPGWRDLVRDDLAGRLAGSSIAFEPVAEVSALTGEGIEALRDRLGARAGSWTGSLRRDDLLRLPVDRVFSLAGAGTVVTGTVWSGSVRVGDLVRLEPGGVAGRVRSLESFGRPAAEAGPGSRAAVGLAGPERAAVTRGQVMVAAGDAWEATEIVDAELTLLPEAPRAVTSRSRLRFHHGTAEVMARALPRRDVRPGESGLVRLVLERPVLVRGDDRFVVRSYSPVRTIGGGRVLDPAPPRRASWPPPLASRLPGDRLGALVERRREGLPVVAIPAALGVPPLAVPALLQAEGSLIGVGERVALAAWVEAAKGRLLDAVRQSHTLHPSMPGPSQETLRSGLGAMAWLAGQALDHLVSTGALDRSGGTVSLPGFVPSSGGGEGEVTAVVEAIERAGLEGLTLAAMRERLDVPDLDGAVRIAAGRGLIEALERDRFVGRGALGGFASLVRELAAAGVEISPAELRTRLGLSRKFLIPLLEWGDRAGVTRRGPSGERFLTG